MRRLGYIRGSGHEKQREEITSYADGPGMRVTFFEDRDSNGETRFDERPGGKALLETVRHRDRVYITSLDRLSRNYADLLCLLQALTGLDVAICLVKGKSGCAISASQLRAFASDLAHIRLNLPKSPPSTERGNPCT